MASIFVTYFFTLIIQNIIQYVFQKQKNVKFVDDVSSYNQKRIKKIVGHDIAQRYCLFTRIYGKICSVDNFLPKSQFLFSKRLMCPKHILAKIADVIIR